MTNPGSITSNTYDPISRESLSTEPGVTLEDCHFCPK